MPQLRLEEEIEWRGSGEMCCEGTGEHEREMEAAVAEGTARPGPFRSGLTRPSKFIGPSRSTGRGASLGITPALRAMSC